MRHYWIIVHDKAGPWPQTCSYFNFQAVRKIRAAYDNKSWRAIKRMGFSLHKIKITKA